MSLISKTGYLVNLVTFKSMTSRVVQRERALRTYLVRPSSSQGVNNVIKVLRSSTRIKTLKDDDDDDDDT